MLAILGTLYCRAGAAFADKFQVTAEERAACTGDAERLCADAYPDEEKLLGCMMASKNDLSAVCRVAFKKGLKRRGIPF